MWGSKKSLKKHGDEDSLWEDLNSFFEEQYSADRMKLVIQVKTKDNLADLRSWVEQSFSIIENKNYGSQNYAKIDN